MTSHGARAAVLREPGDVRLEHRPPEEASLDNAVVRLVASAICGTDVEIFHGGIPVAPGRVMGHEGAGVVEEAPNGGDHLEPGSRVVINPILSCGRCAECLENRGHLCSRGGLLGRDADGVFADSVSVPVSNVHPLPEYVRLDDAPAIQVLSTVVHAQEKVHVVPGRVAAVVGLGFTGQLHAQLLARRGSRVLGVTRSSSKRELASRLACEWTASPSDAGTTLSEAGVGEGADLVVESSGTLAGLAQAIELVRLGGTILCFSILTESEGALAFYDLYYKEINLVAARAAQPRDMEIAVDLVSRGAVDIAPLITDRMRLEDVGEALERSSAGALKVVMEH